MPGGESYPEVHGQVHSQVPSHAMATPTFSGLDDAMGVDELDLFLRDFEDVSVSTQPCDTETLCAPPDGVVPTRLGDPRVSYHRTEAAEQSEGYETSVPGLFFDLPPTSVDLEIAEIKRDNAKLSVTVQDFAKRLAVLEDVYRDGHLMPNLRSLSDVRGQAGQKRLRRELLDSAEQSGAASPNSVDSTDTVGEADSGRTPIRSGPLRPIRSSGPFLRVTSPRWFKVLMELLSFVGGESRDTWIDADVVSPHVLTGRAEVERWENLLGKSIFEVAIRQAMCKADELKPCFFCSTDEEGRPNGDKIHTARVLAGIDIDAFEEKQRGVKQKWVSGRYDKDPDWFELLEVLRRALDTVDGKTPSKSNKKQSLEERKLAMAFWGEHRRTRFRLLVEDTMKRLDDDHMILANGGDASFVERFFLARWFRGEIRAANQHVSEIVLKKIDGECTLSENADMTTILLNGRLEVSQAQGPSRRFGAHGCFGIHTHFSVDDEVSVTPLKRNTILLRISWADRTSLPKLPHQEFTHEMEVDDPHCQRDRGDYQSGGTPKTTPTCRDRQSRLHLSAGGSGPAGCTINSEAYDGDDDDDGPATSSKSLWGKPSGTGTTTHERIDRSSVTTDWDQVSMRSEVDGPMVTDKEDVAIDFPLNWTAMDAEEANSLGIQYFYGSENIAREVTEAHRLFKKAASMGSADGLANLGETYLTGVGTEANVPEGIKHLTKAAAGGSAIGECKLAFHIFHGRYGLVKDEKKALDLYKSAARRGSCHAKCMLGVLYKEGAAGLPIDIDTAIQYFEEAVIEEPIANYHLGLAYEFGEGKPKDLHYAAEHYSAAAAAGIEDAADRLRQWISSAKPCVPGYDAPM